VRIKVPRGNYCLREGDGKRAIDDLARWLLQMQFSILVVCPMGAVFVLLYMDPITAWQRFSERLKR
jgi:hypothetical protein